MANANPSFIVEQSVQYFLHQWHCGLQPSLSFNTRPNGVVRASLRVGSIPPFTLNSQAKHHSGKSSRLRRKRKRKRVHAEPVLTSSDDARKIQSKHDQVAQHRNLSVNSHLYLKIFQSHQNLQTLIYLKHVVKTQP